MQNQNRHYSSIADPVVVVDSHLFIRQGGTFNWTCTFVTADVLESVVWFHNGSLIAPNHSQWVSNRRVCSTKTRKNCSIETTFSLVIENVNFENSGYYSCAPIESIPPKKAFVEIIGGTYCTQAFFSQKFLFSKNMEMLITSKCWYRTRWL